MRRKQRREDYLAVLEEIIDYAIDVDADAILHNGNLFWSQSPESVLDRCHIQLDRASQAGVNFLLLRGDCDQMNSDILSQLEDDGLVTRLDSRWNEIGDGAVFVNDGTVENPEADCHYPLEDTPFRIAAFKDDLEATTGFSDVRAYEGAVGWALDAILFRNQERPVQRVEDGVNVLSPGQPERVVGKWVIDDNPDWEPQIFVYNFTDNGASVTCYKTDARPRAGFRLDLDSTDTLNDIHESLPETDLTEAAVIFEITGEKPKTARPNPKLRRLSTSRQLLHEATTIGPLLKSLIKS